MAHDPSNPPASSTLTRLSAGLGLKSSNRTREDWHIPYNGPYEIPKPFIRRSNTSDSNWGGDADDTDTFIRNPMDRRRTHHKSFEYGGWTTDGSASQEQRGRKGFPVLSGLSTISTFPTSPSSGISQIHRSIPGITSPSSFSQINGGGSIGECPVPTSRNQQQLAVGANWLNLVNLLPFGGSGQRRSVHVPAPSTRDDPAPNSPKPARLTKSPPGYTRNAAQPGPAKPIDPFKAVRDSGATAEDYYDSYYSTLLVTPVADRNSRRPRSISHDGSPRPSSDLRAFEHIRISKTDSFAPSSGRVDSSASPRIHPYARAAPSNQGKQRLSTLENIPPPDTKPKSPINGNKRRTNHPNKSVVSAFFESRRLKSSRSVPNFSTRSQPASPQVAEVIDCWISAESWCDALIYPKPRFKLERQGKTAAGQSGSPDGIHPTNTDDTNRNIEDLDSVPNGGPTRQASQSHPRRRNRTLPPKLRSPAPRGHSPTMPSFAKDDLLLPSPTSSLVRVLQEGETLEAQRKAWQEQAQRSFGNRRSRSLSRSRSKSLTHARSHSDTGVKDDDKPLGHMDFLAARSLVGNQGSIRVRPSRKLRRRLSSSRSRDSHARMGSKSSSGRTHSRASSWSRSALKLAKSTTFGAFCRMSDTSSSPPAGADALERAIKSTETKRVRLGEAEERWEDPLSSTSPASGGRHSSDSPAVEARPNTTSPSPTGDSVGVALSTADPDLLPVQLLDHPYSGAQGLVDLSAVEDENYLVSPPLMVDYAGPHPSSTPVIPNMEQMNDVASRHRLPPHATLHPYGQVYHRQSTSSQNSAGIRTRPRSDSLVPPPEKLWIPGNPNEVREILPEEIQYSPYIPTPVYSHAFVLPENNRATKLGMAEVLTSSLENPGQQKDNLDEEEGDSLRVQTFSEDDPHVQSLVVPHRPESQSPVTPTSSVRRKPVVYDFPMHPEKKPLSPNRNQFVEEDSSGSSPPVSSSQTSPRTHGIMDDLDRFRDLFYEPASSPLDKHHSSRTRVTSEDIPWDVGSSRTASGLTALARQLSEEMEELNSQNVSFSVHDDAPAEQVNPLRRQPSATNSTELRFILTDISKSRTRSSPEAQSSLHFPDDDLRPVNRNIPSDIESSRTSSPLDPSHGESDSDVPRVRSVEVVTTPPAVEIDRRASGHLSFVDVDGSPGDDRPPSTARSQARSGLQPTSADLSRQSYMTSSTYISRMSGLSDFPSPPGTTDPTSSKANHHHDMSVDESESQMIPDKIPDTERVARRMTFGQDEEEDAVLDES